MVSSARDHHNRHNSGTSGGSPTRRHGSVLGVIESDAGAGHSHGHALHLRVVVAVVVVMVVRAVVVTVTVTVGQLLVGPELQVDQLRGGGHLGAGLLLEQPEGLEPAVVGPAPLHHDRQRRHTRTHCSRDRPLLLLLLLDRRGRLIINRPPPPLHTHTLTHTAYNLLWLLVSLTYNITIMVTALTHTHTHSLTW